MYIDFVNIITYNDCVLRAVPEGKLNGCNGEILIPANQIDLVLREGENHIAFLPEQPGIVSYSCWMGMIRKTIEVTDS